MAKLKQEDWTGVRLRKRDHALLLRMAEKADLPMGAVMQAALYDLARKWRVSIDDPQPQEEQPHEYQAV